MAPVQWQEAVAEAEVFVYSAEFIFLSGSAVKKQAEIIATGVYIMKTCLHYYCEFDHFL